MNATQLYIKNMVCNRCIKVVNEELNKLGFKILSIELGRVEIKNKLDKSGIDIIRKMLTDNGFELIDDKKSKLIDNCKF